MQRSGPRPLRCSIWPKDRSRLAESISVSFSFATSNLFFVNPCADPRARSLRQCRNRRDPFLPSFARHSHHEESTRRTEPHHAQYRSQWPTSHVRRCVADFPLARNRKEWNERKVNRHCFGSRNLSLLQYAFVLCCQGMSARNSSFCKLTYSNAGWNGFVCTIFSEEVRKGQHHNQRCLSQHRQ